MPHPRIIVRFRAHDSGRRRGVGAILIRSCHPSLDLRLAALIEIIVERSGEWNFATSPRQSVYYSLTTSRPTKQFRSALPAAACRRLAGLTVVEFRNVIVEMDIATEKEMRGAFPRRRYLARCTSRWLCNGRICARAKRIYPSTKDAVFIARVRKGSTFQVGP